MRRRNRNLRKLCECAAARWGECPHPWHVNMQIAGRLYRCSLDKHLGKHVQGRRDAEGELRTIRQQIKDGVFRFGLPTPIVGATEQAGILTFREIANKWLADAGKGGGARLVAVKDHTYRLNQVCAFIVPGTNPPRAFGVSPIDHLTASDIEAYRMARKAAAVSVVTRNHDMKLLRQVWNWALRHRLIERTPFRKRKA